jgi:hypothetical protein
VRLLLEFRQLSELELLIRGDHDLKYIAKCFSRLHNLRKLKINFVSGGKWYPNRPNPINEVGMIIGANLNLTHLELFENYGDNHPVGGNLSMIFGYVPPNSPLKLEHLCLSDNFSDAAAIASHARSLRSIYLCGYKILTVMYAERIFPPIIETSRVNGHLINYLNHHPQIVGLSIYGNHFKRTVILEIMARHSESLKYFSTSSSGFFLSLRAQTEPLLLRCTKLEQLTILYDHHDYCSQTDYDNLVSRQW